MKKLLIICGVGLIIYCMANPAFPLSYEIDVGQNGFDTGGTVNLYGQTGVNIDVILDGYACPPDDKFFGVEANIILDESLLQVSSCQPNAAAGCDQDLSACSWQGDDYYTPDPDVWTLICSNFSFIQNVNQIKLGTFTVDCVGTGTTDMVVASDLTAYGHPDFNDGYVADCNLQSQYPDDGMVTIELLPPPCACDISGPATIQASAFNHVTAIYVSSQVAFTDCANPPAYSYSDTCILGDINPNTGLLTVPATMVGELCEVCSIDTANTAVTVECCQNIRIVPGDT